MDYPESSKSSADLGEYLVSVFLMIFAAGALWVAVDCHRGSRVFTEAGTDAFATVTRVVERKLHLRSDPDKSYTQSTYEVEYEGRTAVLSSRERCVPGSSLPIRYLKADPARVIAADASDPKFLSWIMAGGAAFFGGVAIRSVVGIIRRR